MTEREIQEDKELFDCFKKDRYYHTNLFFLELMGFEDNSLEMKKRIQYNKEFGHEWVKLWEQDEAERQEIARKEEEELMKKKKKQEKMVTCAGATLGLIFGSWLCNAFK